ncbi:MAG TPA: OmpA family protein [Methylomirabilota bacterium]|nr:OmpA family protein [Methylomirabilota bacterium]
MRRPALKSVILVLSTLALSALLMGCPKRPPTVTGAAPDGQGSAGSEAAAPAAFTPTPPPAPPKEFGTHQALKDVFFGFAHVDVRRTDMVMLDSAADWLKKNPGWLVQIEGHTDDRGSRGENLNIGERRAEWVKNYLVTKGVDASRISTVSYGSDRPVCADKNEGCRARNRRAHFLVREP